MDLSRDEILELLMLLIDRLYKIKNTLIKNTLSNSIPQKDLDIIKEVVAELDKYSDKVKT